MVHRQTVYGTPSRHLKVLPIGQISCHSHGVRDCVVTVHLEGHQSCLPAVSSCIAAIRTFIKIISAFFVQALLPPSFIAPLDHAPPLPLPPVPLLPYYRYSPRGRAGLIDCCLHRRLPYSEELAMHLRYRPHWLQHAARATRFHAMHHRPGPAAAEQPRAHHP